MSERDKDQAPRSKTGTSPTHQTAEINKEPMKLFLPVVLSHEADSADTIELRSALNNALLATIGHDGVYLWNRRVKARHLLQWEDLLKCYQVMQQSNPPKGTDNF